MVVCCRAVGDTDPRAALRYALQLKPDVIYFLTDGSFDRRIGHELEKLVQPNAVIHTFAFGDRIGEKLLKKIAANNRGRYHYIP